MTKKRPVNLDIGTIHFPITAIVSILHRISGIILFGVVAVLLWTLDTSLSGPDGFASIRDYLTSPVAKVVLWVCLAALAYHLVAGIRHLLMDIGIGESLEGGRLGAKLTMAFSIVLILLAGVWVW